MTDFAARRTIMVDTQVRPSDVTKYPIIDAMLTVPRERYVPENLREAAYIGENLDLGGGRVMLEPRTLSKMLDALDIQPDELVLDIGSAQGYSAAVIACLAEAVVAVEDDEARASDAEETLAAEGVDNVAVVNAPLVEGAPQHGPYDVMIVQGAVETFPQSLMAQLKDGGRVTCLFMEGALGVVRLGYRSGDEMDWRRLFNASAPVLEGFARPPAFTF